MRADISQKNFIWPEIVHQGVSEGKLKIFGMSVERAKNFEFAQRNPLVDIFGQIKFFWLISARYLVVGNFTDLRLDKNHHTQGSDNFYLTWDQ